MTELPQGLSKPALRALDSIDVKTLEDLSRYSQAEITALHGMGPKGVTLLVSALSQSNLSFRQ